MCMFGMRAKLLIFFCDDGKMTIVVLDCASAHAGEYA